MRSCYNSSHLTIFSVSRQKLAYDQENIQKAAYIESSISILPGGKDIFDLTNLKRTVGKLIPQFANYR